jgi:hypothetical protein
MPERWVVEWRRAVAQLARWPWLDARARLFVRLLLVLVLGLSVVKGHQGANMMVASGFREISWGRGVYLRSARWMKKELPPGSLVALGEAGLVPYYTRLPALDLYGLNDKHIARREGAVHTKFDADYVFARNPDYFYLLATWSPTEGWTSNQHHAVTLFRDPRFTRNYELVRDFGGAALFGRRRAR